MLPMGLEAQEPAVEDDEAAAWITALLEGRRQDFEPVRARLLDCDGARRLRRLGQDDDLAACTELDTRDLVPVVLPGDPPRAVAMTRRIGMDRLQSPDVGGLGCGPREG